MKIAEIKINTTDLVDRIEAETANYNQMVINHSISPLENPAQRLNNYAGLLRV